MSDIKYAYPLILNKVASPQYATPVLRRARLLDWLNEAQNCRAVVIAADAGYGKTTLLWQWEREVTFPCYWYKLDRTDRDWTFHISYLIEAISKHHRGFGRRAHSMLQQMGGPGSSRPGVTAYLLAEMHERLTDPCTFIIDDWHAVSAATEVRGLWNQILRDAPATCRFVFASRARPRLQFARFKTHGGYAELQTDALRFTQSEIAELFRDVYNDPLDPAEVTELEQRTEGWAASLQLVEVSLRERPTPEERGRFIRSITAGSDSDLFSFLAEEVLDQQPDETRNFLLSTSILQQITPEVAERLTGVQDGRRALVELEHRGLFTNRLDDIRFRYHNLFREFLERRLTSERSEAEVVGLHIHAASYFETTEQWPEAIHHYLRAGLHRQAARLMARYGEDVAREGRLGLVDDWADQLPVESVRGNARLSLLFGEAFGMKGDFNGALQALERARDYFARKGDRRFEALSHMKLSSLYSNYGDVERAIAASTEGLALVPEDDIATRLRLQGNLTITELWLTQPMDLVAMECRRIANESAEHGFEHLSAIAWHNLGAVQWRMGRYTDAIASLERAAQFWTGSPTNPFADNAELVHTLVCAGRLDRARIVAAESLEKTRPWRRPHAEALYGQAAILIADGRFQEAVDALRTATRDPSLFGSTLGTALSRLIEALYLSGAPTAEIASVAQTIGSTPPDPRFTSEWVAAQAVATHATTACVGECLYLFDGLRLAEARGANGVVTIGRSVEGWLLLSHDKSISAVRRAWTLAADAVDSGLANRVRWWLRLYVPFAPSALKVKGGIDLLIKLADADPDGWRRAIIQALQRTKAGQRDALLRAAARHANQDTLTALKSIAGRDIAETRRYLQQSRASRIFLRTFGGVSLHKGDWFGPTLPIDKKRVRLLLGVLAARAHTTLTRDMAVEALWPDADADAGINSLNQTVFQLRRFIDPGYRGGESPEYVISTADQVALNPDLVLTDLGEVRRLERRLAASDWHKRQAAAKRAIGLVRGEFLADLRYEEWTAVQQLAIHAEVREHLLPIAMSAGNGYEPEVSAMAASALTALDPYDEAAVLALADSLARTGRRVAARDLIVGFAQRLRAEIDEELPEAVARAVGKYGPSGLVKH